MPRHVQTVALTALGLALILIPAPPAFAQLLEQTDPAFGQVEIEADSSTAEAGPAEKAAFIAQYDDGTPDVYLRSAADTYEVAMLFENVGGQDVTLGSVDMCWRQSTADQKIRYEVVLWAPDGPAGTPGTEMAHFAAVADGVTDVPDFYTTSLNYPLTASDVYIGVRWNPAVDPDFWSCIDDDGFDGSTVHPGFSRINESSPWSSISNLISSYNALMLRAFLFTPGVFAENLYVPFYLVNKAASGTTTLFAVRNLTDGNVSATIEYKELDGTSQRTDNVNLGPFEVETVNVRDVPGLSVDMDGFARGSVQVTTAGNPDMTPVLGGDYFQVDTVNNFATGEQLVRQIELCTDASVRQLTFGAPTQLTILINNPRGVNVGVDPPSFVVRAYDETGTQSGAAIPYYTNERVVYIDSTTLTALGFGTLRFDFTNSGGGTVYAEYRAEGRFSVGVAAQCDELP